MLGTRFLVLCKTSMLSIVFGRAKDESRPEFKSVTQLVEV